MRAWPNEALISLHKFNTRTRDTQDTDARFPIARPSQVGSAPAINDFVVQDSLLFACCSLCKTIVLFACSDEAAHPSPAMLHDVINPLLPHLCASCLFVAMNLFVLPQPSLLCAGSVCFGIIYHPVGKEVMMWWRPSWSVDGALINEAMQSERRHTPFPTISELF